MASAHSTAALARVKAAANESPAVEKTCPSYLAMVSLKIWSWTRSDPDMASGLAAHRRVDPSTSEKRKVIVPVGMLRGSPGIATN